MKKKKLEKVDFTVVSPGDKLIIQTPRLPQHEGQYLAVMARKFLRDPFENVLIIPEGFRLFLLKKGSDLELEKKDE